MKIKKIISLVLSFCIILSTFATNVYAQEDDNISQKILKQEKALSNYFEITDKINDTKEYKDAYAGAYIDTDGNLNINFVEEKNIINSIEKELKLEDVKFHSKKHSLADLNNVMNILSSKMVALDIGQIVLDEENNKVYVYLNDLNSNKINIISKLVTPSAIEFKKQEVKFTSTASITNGKEAAVLVSGTTGEAFTAGCGAVLSSTGAKGFLIAGHTSASKGSSVYMNGNVVGTLESKQFSGKVDAAFIKCSSSYTPSRNFMNGDSYVAATVDTSQYGLVQGMTVYSYGAVSGKQTGKVLSTSLSTTIDGVSMTNLVQCDYKAIKGDSGAAVVYNRYKGSATTDRCVLGLQSASALVNDQWVDGYSTTLCSRIDFIFSALGLTDGF